MTKIAQIIWRSVVVLYREKQVAFFVRVHVLRDLFEDTPTGISDSWRKHVSKIDRNVIKNGELKEAWPNKPLEISMKVLEPVIESYIFCDWCLHHKCNMIDSSELLFINSAFYFMRMFYGYTRSILHADECRKSPSYRIYK